MESARGTYGYGNYELRPTTKMECCPGQSWAGYEEIVEEIRKRAEARLVVAECYPGADMENIAERLSAVGFDAAFNAEQCVKEPEELERLLQPRLTGDRVFGFMEPGQRLSELYRAEKLQALRDEIARHGGERVLVYGTGASLAAEGDLLLYFDLSRREIQLRYSAGMGNFHGGNEGAPYLGKFKRGYFIEWRMADAQKAALLPKIDYMVDVNRKDAPAMCTGEAFREGMRQISRRPFRLVPYFAPEVWGGQWLKEAFGLDREVKNYAWGFDGIPEENSIVLDFGHVQVELPAMDLVLAEPENLLGGRVYREFGAEFPIRFDLLDTMGGQNLSLQVHPNRGYIREKFGMAYTQDESYYILDTAGEESCVYLGLKEGVGREELERALKSAGEGTGGFEAERFVNRLPVKKHDHVLIPAGTVHCSGSNTMVLEISATPYIFTFKMWDWGRLGLDGLPRPTHIGHAMENVDFGRDAGWVRRNLIHREETVREDGAVTEVHTGLHELEFIESRRCRIYGASRHDTGGTVHVLNLVEGAEAVVESPRNDFPPFPVHYAETFIIPASVGEYVIRPWGASEGKAASVVKAYVRGTEAPPAGGSKDS